MFGNSPTRAPDFVSLARNLQPAVVNVSAMLAPKGKGSPGGQRPGLGEADGVILTNAHVVEGAKKIFVRLVDKREFEANIIGKDLPMDIALLKIAAKEPLPTLSMGDSDTLQVENGLWQWAIRSVSIAA